MQGLDSCPCQCSDPGFRSSSKMDLVQTHKGTPMIFSGSLTILCSYAGYGASNKLSTNIVQNVVRILIKSNICFSCSKWCGDQRSALSFLSVPWMLMGLAPVMHGLCTFMIISFVVFFPYFF